jgi:hypothetical protein
MIKKENLFYPNYSFTQVNELLLAIRAVSASEPLIEPLDTEIVALSAQQDALKALKADKIARLAERKEALGAECQELIRGAGPNVGTEKMVRIFNFELIKIIYLTIH